MAVQAHFTSTVFQHILPAHFPALFSKSDSNYKSYNLNQHWNQILKPKLETKTKDENIGRLLNKKFKKVRPLWLINYETGFCLELDGYCKQLKLAFEYDGIQHHIYLNPFHKSKEVFNHQRREIYSSRWSPSRQPMKFCLMQQTLVCRPPQLWRDVICSGIKI